MAGKQGREEPHQLPSLIKGQLTNCLQTAIEGRLRNALEEVTWAESKSSSKTYQSGNALKLAFKERQELYFQAC